MTAWSEGSIERGGDGEGVAVREGVNRMGDECRGGGRVVRDQGAIGCISQRGSGVRGVIR